MRTAKKRVITANDIERLAEKLSWPPEDKTVEALSLMREIITHSIEKIRVALGELRELVDTLPAPGTTVVPANLDALQPGSDIELLCILGLGEPDSAHTNAVWYLLEEVAFILPQVEMLMDELERYAGDAECQTTDEIRSLLAAIPECLFRAIEDQADRTAPPPFEIPEALRKR